MSKQTKVLFSVSFGFSLIFWVLSLVFHKFSVFNIWGFLMSWWVLLFVAYLIFAFSYIKINDMDEIDGGIISNLGFFAAFLLVVFLKWVFQI